MEQQASNRTGPAITCWQLIRDVLGLQIKLLLDGFRDFLLVPISLIMGGISLIRGGRHAGTEFYNLLRLAKKSDHWINLFGAADRLEDSPDGDKPRQHDVDDIITRLETFVINEYHSGDVTRQAKEHFDQLFSSMKNRTRKDEHDSPET